MPRAESISHDVLMNEHFRGFSLKKVFLVGAGREQALTVKVEA
jgi:hypothetical protein